MKCQILFSRKNKKTITNMSSAESPHSLVSVKEQQMAFIYFCFFSEIIRHDISCELSA